MNKISTAYYQQDNVLFIARDLLGKVLFTNINGKTCSGIITETEAYRAKDDKACHAFGNRRTNRTEVMFNGGGIAYVYLCYGIHNLFNIITNVEGVAEGVLIRAIEPISGQKFMLERKNMTDVRPRMSAGPGSMSKALGIGKKHNGISLQSDIIWLEEHGSLGDAEVVQTTRIGVDYAGEDALLPWRFYNKNSSFVSKR